MDTQGSLTHIAEIFKFGDVSGPRATKWPKVNRRLKIVNYFTCMRHFSCRWYRPPEIDLNGYPRISNPYCQIFKFGDVSGPRAKKWPKVNCRLKIVNYFTCMWHFYFTVGGILDPQKLIWIDTQGSLTHIVKIFKFRNVSGPRATKWPKVNRRLKIVNYFRCMCNILFVQGCVGVGGQGVW